ncbi:MAG: PQQ-binding-like beta-propeller repeat protein [Prolixibacteraceae bacterium]
MKNLLLLAVILFTGYSVLAQPVQWRGPDRDGHFPETGLMKSWPEDGPEVILEMEGIGKGYSSPVLAGDMIYVTGMKDTLDYLSAVDMQGNIKWQVPYGRSWSKSFPDTRSTPVVEDNRIYVQSGMGHVSCIDAETGETNWMLDIDKAYETEYDRWGNSETPLIIDNMVICSPAGEKTSVVALDKMTGEELWKSEPVGGSRSYISATEYNFNGHRMILAATASHLIALQPENGKVMWSYQYLDPDIWNNPGLIWANTPVYEDNEIFITMGYDYPAKMLVMDSTASSVKEKYTSRTLDNHHHGVVLHDGHIYGSNWYNNKQGRWVCVVWDTGEIKYVDEWDTKGALVMADGMLYAYNERGNVGLVKPDPDGFEVVSQFRITKGAGPHWAHPFIADGKLLIRHGEVLMVYDIKEK